MRPHFNRGFTFLELMLVLFIVSVFAALVLPKFNHAMASGTLSQASKMADLLSYVNDKALMSKNENVVSLDLDNKTVRFNDAGRDKKMVFSRLSKVALINGEVTSGIALIAVSQWGIQQPVNIFFTDKQESLRVEFNPISAKAVVFE